MPLGAVAHSDDMVEPMNEDAPHFRRTPRRAIGLPVQFQCIGSHMRHRGRLHDLSLGGAFVSAAFLPRPGTELHLHVQAPSCWDEVVLRGRVVRLQPDMPDRGFGVRFLSPGPREASALHALVDAADYESLGDEAS